MTPNNSPIITEDEKRITYTYKGWTLVLADSEHWYIYHCLSARKSWIVSYCKCGAHMHSDSKIYKHLIASKNLLLRSR